MVDGAEGAARQDDSVPAASRSFLFTQDTRSALRVATQARRPACVQPEKPNLGRARGSRGNSRDGLLDELLGKVVGRDVSSDDDGLAASLLDLVDDLLSLCAVKVRNDDLGPLGGKEESARAADSLGGLR